MADKLSAEGVGFVVSVVMLGVVAILIVGMIVVGVKPIAILPMSMSFIIGLGNVARSFVLVIQKAGLNG